MSSGLSGRALLCYTAAALVTVVGSFHTPGFKFNGNNVCPASACSRAASSSATTPGRRGTLRVPITISRRGGLPELNAGPGSGGEEEFYTPADLEAYSKPWGITLHYRSTLNTYRIEAHRPNGEVAGYTTGFYLGDLLHLDKVQVCALSISTTMPLCTTSVCIIMNTLFRVCCVMFPDQTT